MQASTQELFLEQEWGKDGCCLLVGSVCCSCNFHHSTLEISHTLLHAVLINGLSGHSYKEPVSYIYFLRVWVVS